MRKCNYDAILMVYARNTFYKFAIQIAEIEADKIKKYRTLHVICATCHFVHFVNQIL